MVYLQEQYLLCLVLLTVELSCSFIDFFLLHLLELIVLEEGIDAAHLEVVVAYSPAEPVKMLSKL